MEKGTLRTPEEREKMIAVLKNLQSQGQSRDLQIEVIANTSHPDFYAPGYQGAIPNITDDEKNAVSWLYSRTTDEGLVGAHAAQPIADPPAGTEGGTSLADADAIDDQQKSE